MPRTRKVASTVPALSREEIDRYHHQGFLGPYTLLSAADAAARWERIAAEVLSHDGPLPGHVAYARHQDSRLVWDIAAHGSVVGRLRCLLGDDLLLWISSFWIKRPGDLEVPWHQDVNYWPMEPPLTITAWVAMTPSRQDNGRIELIPGSHLHVLPHVPATEGQLFEEQADPQSFDPAGAVAFDLEPGQVLLFNDRVLHRSAVNRTAVPRVGLGSRYTVPFVKLFADRVPLFPGHRAYLVSGRDRFGFNALGRPPA